MFRNNGVGVLLVLLVLYICFVHNCIFTAKTFRALAVIPEYR